MAKKLIISSESSNLYSTKRLLTEGSRLKYSTKWINPYQTSVSTKESKNEVGKYFIRTTGVRYDDFDLVVAKSFLLSGLQITNSIDAVSLFRSKELQSMFFTEHQLSHIPSIVYRGNLSEEIWTNIIKLSSTENYILKMSRGNQGIGVNIINGKQSLKSLLETFHAIKDQRFLIQPYVKHKKEFRVFIIKNEIHAIIERTISDNDFRGNAKRSSGKISHRLPALVSQELLKAASLSGLFYCGIDLIFDGKNYIILEINPVPGFEQIETLTKQNIARELISQSK